LNLQALRHSNEEVAELDELLVWNNLVEPGDRVATSLRGNLGDRGALEKFLARDIREISDLESSDLSSAYERWLPRYQPSIAADSIRLAAKYDMKLLLPSDELWPKSLNDLGSFAPMLLWYRGNPENFFRLEKALSIVGSRTCSNYGQRVTTDVVSSAVEQRATVVSGGALGIDSVAHRAALSQSGHTVAVMAGSLDNLYPSGNWELFEKIAHSGLLVSEMAPGSKPTRWRFLQRNRIIAALGSALVVTEAGWRSGSINTANHCAELGRRVFAIPGPITSPGSAGCNRLIRDNLAELLLDTNDLAGELGWEDSNLPSEEPLGSFERRALDFLTHREQTAEQISAAAGLSRHEIALALGALQLLNLAERGLKGGWKRTK
jgi:DNA processing protein